MIRLICEENNIEYVGSGFIQCGRYINCPKKENSKVLGFDCLVYIDNLPEGCELNISKIHEDSVKIDDIRNVTKIYDDVVEVY